MAKTMMGVMMAVRCQIVQQFRGRHQRFFANHIAAQAQAGGDVRVMQVIGRADADVIQRRFRLALEAMGKIVEAFKLGKKRALRRNAVDDADRVGDVIRHRQMVAQVFDGAHMARGNVASRANQCKIFGRSSRCAHAPIVRQLRAPIAPLPCKAQAPISRPTPRERKTANTSYKY